MSYEFGQNPAEELIVRKGLLPFVVFQVLEQTVLPVMFGEGLFVFLKFAWSFFFRLSSFLFQAFFLFVCRGGAELKTSFNRESALLFVCEEGGIALRVPSYRILIDLPAQRSDEGVSPVRVVLLLRQEVCFGGWLFGKHILTEQKNIKYSKKYLMNIFQSPVY